MSISTNASFDAEKNKLQSGGMLNLFQVQVQASPILYEYWAEYNATITYFIPGTVTTQTYTPFPISRGEIETDDGSKAPTLDVNIGAVDQTIISYMESNDALRRNRVKAITVPKDMLGNASACIVDTFYIDGAAIDHDKEIASFQLTSRGQVDNVTVPLRSMRRDQCQWKYNASDCIASSGASGYKTALTDSKCKHTKADCASKNNVINFGAFPGIGTRKIVFR